MKTNAAAIAEFLSKFDSLEDYEKDFISDFIACPSFPDCAWDGKLEHVHLCTDCKVRWLEQESEEIP